ncbi:stage II sporulation protein M [Candidatus Woesearchaeota archaeon]|nr:stage II sporulation protein M [Candidatus Woesearchaeota archaeon]
MVFEQLFRTDWIERKPRYAFLLGVCYSILGIISARLIFGKNPSMMTVAFTSVLLIPSLNRLLLDEENVEIREKKLSLKMLFLDHKDIFGIYFFLFMGIFMTYALLALLMPEASVFHLFSTQLAVGGFAGQAFQSDILWSILLNNIKVLFVCLVLSFVYGAGSILFIVWNASVWGTIFGYVAQQSAFAASGNALYYFGATIIPVLPHMVTEALSYFSAAIVGGVVSKAVLREDLFSEKFHHIITDGLIFLVLGLVLVTIAAIIEVQLF